MAFPIEVHHLRSASRHNAGGAVARISGLRDEEMVSLNDRDTLKQSVAKNLSIHMYTYLLRWWRKNCKCDRLML